MLFVPKDEDVVQDTQLWRVSLRHRKDVRAVSTPAETA
jgi:hypothetical protein